MARYTYVILGRAVDGREEDFRAWYRDQHLGDVRALPGVIAARLLAIDTQTVMGADLPPYSTIALYELDCEDPQATIDAMFAVAGTDKMPMTDTIEMAGMAQFIAQELKVIG